MGSLRVVPNYGHEISKMCHACVDTVLLTERPSNPLSWLQAEMLVNVSYLNLKKGKRKQNLEKNTFPVLTVPSKNYPVRN